jgi:hypothetical protein
VKAFALKSAVALIALSTASAGYAQHAGHTMSMPMPMPETKKAPAKKPVVKKPTAKKPTAKKPVAKKAVAKKPAAKKPAVAMPPMDHSQMDMGKESEPAPAQVDHSQMDHGQMNMGQGTQPGMAPMDHAAMGHGGMAGHEAMRGALGNYPMTREASGTSWQPDSSMQDGVMRQSGDWMLMAHGHVDLIGDWQGGKRGDDKIFVAGMLMGMATRDFANGNALQFKAMISPDPLMGKRGYPLLLASGETANGTDRLIDRQHPHDFFMELSGSYSVQLDDKASAFLYAGLPGEPAFGPPAFMHRQSIDTSPEAPITHHWLDSTHITFGVVTGGLIVDRVKLEASRFNGREPDQYRWNIETGPLDSTSVRLSWNPTTRLSLQGSWAHLEDPEQLEPGVNQRRWTASGIYTRPMTNGWWSSTLAWGRKTVEGHKDDAVALESSLNWKDWTLFGRGEFTENRELVEGQDSPAYKVGKVSLGLVRDFAIGGPFKLGMGGLYAKNFVPNSLEHLYGGDPGGAMAFVRLKLE